MPDIKYTITTINCRDRIETRGIKIFFLIAPPVSVKNNKKQINFYQYKQHQYKIRKNYMNNEINQLLDDLI